MLDQNREHDDQISVDRERDPLDPDGWDRSEVTHALDPQRIGPDPRPAAATGTAVLVGSTGPFATLAGRHALDAGGSATDAVLTTAFTQIALSLGSWVSYAGFFGMVHHEATTGATSTVSAGFGTFTGETRPAEIPPAPTPSGRTALVPGFVAGAHAAHRSSGRLPWAQLWSPARHLLERGVPVSPHLARLLDLRADVLTRTDEGRAAFTPDGRLPRAGELAAQPRLAATLAALADHGPDWMYRGPWAEHFVAAVRHDGGYANHDDLASYRARRADPARGSFAGHEIATLPAPDTGGVDLLSTLARLEAAGVGEPSRDPDALVGLLSALEAPSSGGHSDYVIAVDSRGNVAAVCHSINTAMWGTTGIVVDGVPVPDPAAFQQAALTPLAPGDHLPMPVEPAIALHHGRPVLACSSIGIGLHPATVLGLHRVLALSQPVAAAVGTPLVHGPDVVVGDSVTSLIAHRDDNADPGRVVDDCFPPTCVAAARAAGHAVTPRTADDPNLPRGFWGAIGTDPTTGRFTGARTPYGQGPVRSTP